MNEKLPSWANCWVKNELTGEVKPAFDNDQTWEVHGEDGSILGREWTIVITDQEKIGFLIIVFLAAIGVIFAAIFWGVK